MVSEKKGKRWKREKKCQEPFPITSLSRRGFDLDCDAGAVVALRAGGIMVGLQVHPEPGAGGAVNRAAKRGGPLFRSQREPTWRVRSVAWCASLWD
jgi:hypothetical protein